MIDSKLEIYEIEIKQRIINKFYFKHIQKCMEFMQRDYDKAFISMNLVDEINWENHLQIDLNNIHKYNKDLSEQQIQLKQLIEQTIDAEYEQNNYILNFFGYKLTKQNMPHVIIVIVISIIGYSIYITFKELIIGPILEKEQRLKKRKKL
ncbi:hypothetical protein IMG5_056330, partial [Ichthyophthirius multifiliis]